MIEAISFLLLSIKAKNSLGKNTESFLHDHYFFRTIFLILQQKYAQVHTMY